MKHNIEGVTYDDQHPVTLGYDDGVRKMQFRTGKTVITFPVGCSADKDDGAGYEASFIVDRDGELRHRARTNPAAMGAMRGAQVCVRRGDRIVRVFGHGDPEAQDADATMRARALRVVDVDRAEGTIAVVVEPFPVWMVQASVRLAAHYGFAGGYGLCRETESQEPSPDRPEGRRRGRRGGRNRRRAPRTDA